MDDFKTINDQQGHSMGDMMLVKAARAMRDATRQCDVLARCGGDEFAILLPEVGEEMGITIADRVRQIVSGDTGDGSDSLIQIPIKISMGVAEHKKGDNLSLLIRAADAALYRAKHAGRNVVSN